VSQERVLACKRLRDPDDFAKEVENLEVIRRNAQQHNRIMVHLGTVAVGTSFNIFYQWADQDLRQLLYESNLEEPERLLMLKEAGNLANAVGFLHTNIKDDGRLVKFFHMDLKPENILVVKQANDPIGRWMITDFGISTVHDHLAGSKTTAKRRRGAFQPPEIDESWVDRPHGVNEKGDIWALGCILCMVLAFIIGGKGAVVQLQHSRRYGELGRLEQDFFYVLDGEPGSKAMMLKKPVDDWLTNIEKAKPLDWVCEYIDLIRSTLRINQELRPSAAKIDERLDDISRMSIGQLTRNMTQASLGFNAVRPASQPRARNQQPASLINSEATPGPSLREIVTGGGSSSPTGFSLRRNTEPGQQSRRGTGSNEAPDSPSPAPWPEEGLRHLITPTSPSSGSSGSLKFEERSIYPLLDHQEANQKHLAVDSCICPTADRIVLSLKNAAVLYERHHDGQYTFQHKWVGKWEHAYLAGPYLALQSVNNATVSRSISYKIPKQLTHCSFNLYVRRF
jgi:serine/threonine protein kinase